MLNKHSGKYPYGSTKDTIEQGFTLKDFDDAVNEEYKSVGKSIIKFFVFSCVTCFGIFKMTKYSEKMDEYNADRDICQHAVDSGVIFKPFVDNKGKRHIIYAYDAGVEDDEEN